MRFHFEPSRKKFLYFHGNDFTSNTLDDVLDLFVREHMVMIRNKKSHEKILQENFHENDIRDDILQWLIENDVKEQLNKLEAQLTDAERDIYEAYFIQNQSTQQIAQTRKITNAAVRGAIQRIRKKATQLPISLILLILYEIMYTSSL